jgi:hypothetical protein
MSASTSRGGWRWLRFSLRELLSATALLLIGLMSLIHAVDWVPNLWFTLLLLTIAVAIACWRAGVHRLFAEGYLLFGGGYALLLCMAFWPYDSKASVSNQNAIHGLLLTHSLNDWAYLRLLPLVREPPPPPANQGGFFGGGPLGQFGPAGPAMDLNGDGGADSGEPAPSGLSLVFGGGQTVLSDYPDHANFQLVAHCLWAIVAGCIGGRFMERFRRPRPETTNPSST